MKRASGRVGTQAFNSRAPPLLVRRVNPFVSVAPSIRQNTFAQGEHNSYREIRRAVVQGADRHSIAAGSGFVKSEEGPRLGGVGQ